MFTLIGVIDLFDLSTGERSLSLRFKCGDQHFDMEIDQGQLEVVLDNAMPGTREEEPTYSPNPPTEAPFEREEEEGEEGDDDGPMVLSHSLGAFEEEEEEEEEDNGVL